MSWLDGLLHKLRTVFRPGEYEREIDEEMRHHRELLVTSHQLPATRPDGRIPNATYHKEEARRMTWHRWLDSVRQDTGYAWRSIRRTPGVTAMIVVTLALGIGVNAAVFSVLDQLYLRNPTGVEDPSSIRRVWLRNTRTVGPAFFSRSLSYPQYRVLAEVAGGEDKLAVMTDRSGYRLGGTLAGPETNVLFTSANYFTILGVRPFLGRLFSEMEARPGIVSRQIVLSHRYWKTHLAGDLRIVGKEIRLDTTAWTVLGVTPEGFQGVEVHSTHAWAPLGSLPGAENGRPPYRNAWEEPRGVFFLSFGRLGDQNAQNGFERASTVAIRESNSRFWGALADSQMTVHTGSIIEARGPAVMREEGLITTRLQAVALIVLIIACANVVNLLLARAVSRRREIAVRLALGISRGRLIRLITIESVVLALLSAVAAILTAWVGGSVLRSQLMVGVEFAQGPLHPHVVWGTIGVALACGLIAGIIPALQYSKPQLTNDLKDSGRANARLRSRLRDGMVIAQAALSVVLLVGAMLCLRTVQNIEGIDIGFDRSRVLYASMQYEPGQAPPLAERATRVADVETRLRDRTGIEAVGRAGNQPMGGLSFWTFWWGSDSSASLRKTFPFGYAVSPAFFVASGIQLLQGSLFGDRAAGEGQVIVNDAMAKLLWPTEVALGQCIRFERRDAPCHVVTGVVSTAAARDIIEAPQPQYYLPLGTRLTANMGGTLLIVRMKPGAETAAMNETRALLKDALPMGIPNLRTMESTLEPKYRRWRLGAKLFSGVGLLALLVALVGIYSTVAYSVGRRRHEFGVRVALGARINDVLNLVVGEGIRIVSVGIALGVALALASARLIASLLYGVEPNDVSALTLSATLMLVIAIVAALVPAWRAARVDPATALRGE